MAAFSISRYSEVERETYKEIIAFTKGEMLSKEDQIKIQKIYFVG